MTPIVKYSADTEFHISIINFWMLVTVLQLKQRCQNPVLKGRTPATFRNVSEGVFRP